MARQPKAKPETKTDEPKGKPLGHQELTEDGKVKTYHALGIVSIDN